MSLSQWEGLERKEELGKEVGDNLPLHLGVLQLRFINFMHSYWRLLCSQLPVWKIA
jgi:hypothetical protein